MASSGSDGSSGRFWWQQLGSRDGRALPPSAIERLTWYEKQVRRKRVGHYAVEVVILLASATVPAAAALGASTATLGVLGAAVTALVPCGD